MKPAARTIITERDSSRTFTIKRTSNVVLRLGKGRNWTTPRVSGRAVDLIAVKYESDPGYQEWRIVRRAAGTATVTSSGKPKCESCATRTRSFRVKLRVPR